jgi:hypothetical protein
VAGVDGDKEGVARYGDKATQAFPFPGDRQAKKQTGDAQKLKAFGGGEHREMGWALAEEEGHEKKE